MILHAINLATRSLWWYRGRTAIIVMCIALTLWLPITVRLLLNQFRRDIIRRAETTPLVIGARGSRIDLALKALYFETVAPGSCTMAEVFFVRRSEYAAAYPLHVNYETQSVNGAAGAPIVGTSVEYLEFRRLAIAEGQGLGILGDCLAGSNVAARMNLKPGDKLLSAPRNAFNLAGDYPLRMNVAGILKPTHSPDDDVIFADIRTAWIIDGIGHGHQKLDQETDERLLLDRSDHSITASAAVLPFTEITADNIDSFHFHGREETYPVTAVIADPHSRRDQTLLLGEYLTERNEIAQCVKPLSVVNDLLQIVFRVEKLVWLSSLLAGMTTLLLLGLVLFLSMRLRAPEMQTMFRIGCSRGMIAWLLGTEIAIMTICGFLIACVSAWGSSLAAASGLRAWLF